MAGPDLVVVQTVELVVLYNYKAIIVLGGFTIELKLVSGAQHNEFHKRSFIFSCLLVKAQIYDMEWLKILPRHSETHAYRHWHTCVRLFCLLVAYRPSNMRVYLRDGSAQTILRAATLR